MYYQNQNTYQMPFEQSFNGYTCPCGYGYGYDLGSSKTNLKGGYALILVLFILLVIIGASSFR